MKKLLLAGIVVLCVSPATAQAQCNYRMNDIGRPHGYLSGPCNGAAQGYAGAYPSRQSAGVVKQSGGATYVTKADGGVFIRRGNVGRGYDANGRLTSTVIRRGNKVSIYDGKGRVRVKADLGEGGGAKIYGREPLP